nr:HGGxSTG domain-containing protein [Bradyrhizobium sp. 40]
MRRAKRCGARTRSGKPCQSPAMPNGRCRMHGGPSPGAPKGNRNALKHGRYTTEAIFRRQAIAALLRMASSSIGPPLAENGQTWTGLTEF